MQKLKFKKLFSKLFQELFDRGNLIIRQLAKKIAGARGHRIIFGTPEEIADQLEEWFHQNACDGYNLLFQYYPTLFEEFVDLVIPILQERGVFRKDYEGSTLREHLGLEKTPFRDYEKILNR